MKNIKRIAAVDGVQNGSIEVTLSTESRGTPVEGTLVVINHDGQKWLARVDGVSLENPVHKDARFAPLIMDRGNVPEWSKLTDIERGKLTVMSIVTEDGKHIAKDRNPPSGTEVWEMQPEEMQPFQREKKHFLCVGTVSNTNVPATIVNRNHRAYSEGGYGEAHHAMYMGQNGSGKTVIVQMNLVGRLAQNPDMGMLNCDVQGDFSKSIDNGGTFSWDWLEAAREAGVNIEIIEVQDVALKSKDLLSEVLAKVFLRTFSMGGTKHLELASQVVEAIFDGKHVVFEKLDPRRILEEARDRIGRIYASAGKEKTERAEDVLNDPAQFRMFKNKFDREVLPFFDGTEDAEQIIRDVLYKHRKIVLNMAWADEYQQMVIARELMDNLTSVAQKMFRSGNQKANAILVLDEAPRWVPEGNNSETGNTVKRALKEARKIGMGVWLVGQSMVDIDKTVLRQSHTQFFGRRLGVGADRKHLLDLLGPDGVALYDRLNNNPDKYFWVVSGHDNNINDTQPMAFDPFSGNATQALMDANPHIWVKEPW